MMNDNTSENEFNFTEEGISKTLIERAYTEKTTPENVLFGLMVPATSKAFLIQDAITLCRVENPIEFCSEHRKDLNHVFNSSFTRALHCYNKNLAKIHGHGIDMENRSSYSTLDKKQVASLLKECENLPKLALAFLALHLSISLDKNGVEPERRLGNTACLSLNLLTELAKYMRLSWASVILSKELTIVSRMPL